MSNNRKLRPPRSAPVLIVCVSHAGIRRPDQDAPDVTGQYLKSYDAEANDGQGDARWTRNPAEAMTFQDVSAAYACWAKVPRRRPVRDYDGEPNRPLTAFTVTFEPAPWTN